MKFNSLVKVLILISIFSIFLSKSALKTEEKQPSSAIVGETFNFEGKNTFGAVTYAMGRVSHSPNEFNKLPYYSPEVVSRLPDRIPPPLRGPSETVDEIPSENDFYDGSKKLNLVKINCKIYAKALDCVHNSHCGWCGSTQGCVAGTNLGPLEPCVKSSFIYANNQNHNYWNPPQRIDDIRGRGFTYTVTK